MWQGLIWYSKNLQCVNPFFLFGRGYPRDSFLIHFLDRVVKPVMALVSVVTLIASCVALYAHGIWGFDIISAIANALMKCLGHVFEQCVQWPGHCSFGWCPTDVRDNFFERLKQHLLICLLPTWTTRARKRRLTSFGRNRWFGESLIPFASSSKVVLVRIATGWWVLSEVVDDSQLTPKRSCGERAKSLKL